MNVCDNCGRRYAQSDLTFTFPNIPGLVERLDPGGMVPAGECPACGALVYPEDKHARLLVVLEGGLVRDVLADKPGIEAAVLDMDVEGVDEDEVVEIVGETDTLRGTLLVQDVTVAPVLVESAYRSADAVAP